MREEKKAIVMLATAMLDDTHSADKQIAFNLGKLEMVADLSHTLEGLGHCVRSELVSHKNIDDVIPYQGAYPTISYHIIAHVWMYWYWYRW